jgi:two-component system OmpR family sensor kinase
MSVEQKTSSRQMDTEHKKSEQLSPSEDVAARETRLHSVWGRPPASGLRWQLAFIYSFLLIALLIAFGLFVFFSGYHSFLLILAAILVLSVIGSVIGYLLTSLTLNPLRQVTDTTQAIIYGDYEQRERLLPLMQGNDEVSKLAASLHTMAEQTEQAHLKQHAAEERSRRLFSDASHQLRTPLTSIRGFTDVLMRGAKDDPEISQRVLRLMKIEAERMTMLVSDLLMLVQLDADTPLQTQYIDLFTLTRDEVERVKMIITDGREISIVSAPTEQLGIQGNEERLKQVLHILIDNALAYGEPAPSGWIHLSLNKEGRYVIIQISNNGKGIHPTDLPHIFERFYRGKQIPIYDEKVKTPPAGTGLGLSIAQAIVQAHAGEISVQSTPDIETVFTIKIPCAKST